MINFDDLPENLFGEEDPFVNFDKPSPRTAIMTKPAPTPVQSAPYYKTASYAATQKTYQPKPAKAAAKKEKEDTVEVSWADYVATLPWGIYMEDKKNPVIYVWNGKCWQPLADSEIENAAEEFLNKYFKWAYTDGKKHSCIGLTQSILYRVGKVLEQPKNRSIISVQGGFIEITLDGSIRLTPHDKTLFIRNYINAPIYPEHCDAEGFYTPKTDDEIEKDGLFSRLVNNSFEDVAVRRAFQEHVGDSLLPENSQVTPLLIGSGGQGKSQWVEIMMAIHTNHAMADLENLDGFAMENFIGASILIVDEVSKRINEKQFKKLFGGGTPVKVDRKYKTGIDWTADIKGFIACNEIPQFSEHSEAIARRICPYPMAKAMHNSGERVKDIGKKIMNGYKVAGVGRGEEVYIPDQKRDVLDWFLNGAIRVVQRGGLLTEDQMPVQCRMEKNQMRHEVEPVWAFIKEMEWQPVDGKGGVTKAEIYQIYVNWANNNGRKGILSTHRFGKDLKRNIEKEFGAASCKEGKIDVRLADGSTGWKTAFRLVAKNTADYQVKYKEFVWSEEEIEAFNAKVAEGNRADATDQEIPF